MAGGAAEGRAVHCCGAFFSCGSLACVAPTVGCWCVALQCAKFRLVTYQLKVLAHRTYVPRTTSSKENEAARQSQAVKCSVGRTWERLGDCDEVRTGASRDEVAVLHPPRHWTARRMCATKEGAFKLVCHQSTFCTLTRYTPQGAQWAPSGLAV